MRRAFIVIVLAVALLLQPLPPPAVATRSSGPSATEGHPGLLERTVAVVEDGVDAVLSWVGSLFSHSSSAAAAAPPSGPSAPEEVRELRTRDAKHYRNPDGTFTAHVGHYLHYEAAPGRWEDVDLTLRPSGSDFAMDRHDLEVRVSAPGVEASERRSGKGIRWLTPARPTVDGRRALYSDHGLRWEYTTTKSGLKLGAMVDRALGPRNYEFRYQLLGDAAPLRVAPTGEMESDAFQIPRAFALGADGITYDASAWRLLPGGRVGFDFDDSGLPPAAFPYLLDPTTTFTVAASADVGFVQGDGTYYPPPAGYSAAANANLSPRKARFSDGTFRIVTGLLRWNTSGLPDDSFVQSATLQVSNCALRNDEGWRSMTADWYAAWPIDLADYSGTPQTSALVGKPLSQFPVAADPLGCMFGSAPGVNLDIPLDNGNGVSPTGYTGLRLHISGDQPSADNFPTFVTLNNPYSPPPRLIVNYAVPPPAPTLVSPANGAVLDTFAPTLQVQNQGAAFYQFTIEATGHSPVTSPWVTAPSWTVPMGVLVDGGDYRWSAVAKSAEGVTSAKSAERTLKVDAQKLGDRSYYPMAGAPLGDGVAASVNAATGNLVVSQTDVSLPTVADPFVISRSYNSRGAGKLSYVDDALPYGAVPEGTWSWDSSRRWSGTQSHKEPTAAGIHQHYFHSAQGKYFVPHGSTIVTYAYLDPASPPREVMLQFDVPYDNSWGHRAYWGENLIPWGADGTITRKRLGNLPTVGGWVRLEVPAAEVGVEGKVVSGVAYTLYDGQAWFDKTYVREGPVGHGWTVEHDLVLSELSFARLLERTDNAHLELIAPTGARHFYYQVGATNQYVSVSGDFATVTKGTVEWELKTAEGVRYFFDRTTGQLLRTELPERAGLASNRGFTYVYVAGRLTALRDAIGRQLSLLYNSDGMLWQVKADFDGGRILATYAYDGHDQLTSVTDAAGQRVDYTYDAATHDLLTITTPRGTATATEGDFRTTVDYQAALANEEHRRVSALRRPHTQGGTTTELVTGFAYTPASRTSKVTAPKGTATTSDPNDFVTTYDYNAQGNPTRVTDAAGNATTMVWNAQNLRTSVTDREGATTTYAYDGNGNLCKTTLPVTNSAGQPATTQHFYDEFAGAYTCSASTKPTFNLRTKTIDAEGRTTTIEYVNPAGGKPWVRKETQGAGTVGAATTSYCYYEDTAQPWRYAKLRTKTMPKGGVPACPATSDYTTTYDYWGPSDTYSFPGDPALANVAQQGWLRSRAKPGDTPVSCGGVAAMECSHYDHRGNAIHVLDAKGDHYAVFDLDNRATESQSLGAVGNPDPSRWVVSTYDPDGNMTRLADPDVPGDQTAFSYDDLNRQSSATDAWGSATTYAYDANGNVTAKTTSGIGTVGYTYDGLDRLATLTDPQSRVTSYPVYDREGRLREKRLPNSTHVDYAYNPAGWVTALQNRRGGSHSGTEVAIADYAYTYDGSGKKVTETRPDGPLSYRYDALGRLSEVTQGSTTRRYDHDANSNRVALKTNGATTKSYTYNARDQLQSVTGPSGTETFVYNTAGEVTAHSLPGESRSYGYDARGRPTGDSSGTESASYLLDGLGRVLRRTVQQAGTTVSDLRYLYDAAGDSRVAERDAATGLLQTSYLADPDGLLASTSGLVTKYQYFSAHGDLVQQVDQLGTASHATPLSYDEFGNSSAPSEPYGYTGQWQRETSGTTGTIRMGARLYDPSLGRFLQVDPVEGGNANDYDYALGDPCNNFDLDGRHVTRGPHPPVDTRCGRMTYEYSKAFSWGAGVRGVWWIGQRKYTKAAEAAGISAMTSVTWAGLGKMLGKTVGRGLLPLSVAASLSDANCLMQSQEWRKKSGNSRATPYRN